MAWGQLGTLRFEHLTGPTEESHQWGANLAEHAMIGDKSRLQHLGPKLNTLALRMRLHTSLNLPPESALRTLKDSMEQGEILDLVIGEQPDAGLWAGRWVIASLDVTVLDRWPGGKLRHAEVALNLKEYVDPPALGQSQRKIPPRAKSKGQKKPPAAKSPSTRVETNRDGFAMTKMG